MNLIDKQIQDQYNDKQELEGLIRALRETY